MRFGEDNIQAEVWFAYDGFDNIWMIEGLKNNNLIHQFHAVNRVSNTVHMDGFQSIGDIFSSVCYYGR